MFIIFVNFVRHYLSKLHIMQLVIKKVYIGQAYHILMTENLKLHVFSSWKVTAVLPDPVLMLLYYQGSTIFVVVQKFPYQKYCICDTQYLSLTARLCLSQIVCFGQRQSVFVNKSYIAAKNQTFSHQVLFY